MGYIPLEINWRNDPGLVSKNQYKRKFAYLPVCCMDGTWVWLKHYYTYNKIWTNANVTDFEDQYYCHIDFIGHISEQEYLVKKLSETL